MFDVLASIGAGHTQGDRGEEAIDVADIRYPKIHVHGDHVVSGRGDGVLAGDRDLAAASATGQPEQDRQIQGMRAHHRISSVERPWGTRSGR